MSMTTRDLAVTTLCVIWLAFGYWLGHRRAKRNTRTVQPMVDMNGGHVILRFDGPQPTREQMAKIGAVLRDGGEG